MSDADFLLLDPGPVLVADDVREAAAEPTISHRSPEFEAVYERVQDGLEYVFTTSTLDGEPTGAGTPLILDGTATMAMEAAVANLVGGGGDVVALVNGSYGRRFARIAERYASVTRVEVEWGDSIPVADVAAAVTDATDVVTMVHSETSTGLLNPVAEVGAVAREHDATFVVDGVTSVGGDAFKLDEWHVDVALTDAQMALAAPPGLSAVFVTDRARERFDGAAAPFYEDLDRYLRAAENHRTPFSSAVPLFRALAVAVEAVADEGMPERIRRHRTYASAFREAFESMGLELFADPDGPTRYSNTVTAVSLPDAVSGVDADAFFDGVAARNVSVADGQAHLGSRIFRVGNMGALDADDVRRGIEVVADAMTDAGVDVDVEAALVAAEERLD